MAKNAPQKLKLLYLCQALWERSDENHPIPIATLIALLAQEGIFAERKSIYSDMAALADFGLDVRNKKGKTPGWYLGERSFALADLKLLVDAVQACRFITRRKGDALIRSLASLASAPQARQLKRQICVAGRVETMNESVCRSMDKLHAAITGGHAVTFQYFEYSVSKEKVFRRDGKRYTVSPRGLIWTNDHHYLVGYDHARAEIRHYRVDHMAALVVTCLPCAAPCAALPELSAYAQKHFAMFGGTEAQVTLRVRNGLVGAVLDRFGRDSCLIPCDAGHFTVTVPAVVSPQFMGWLFGLGDGVRILSPDWAAQALLAQADAVLQLYRAAPAPSEQQR